MRKRFVQDENNIWYLIEENRLKDFRAWLLRIRETGYDGFFDDERLYIDISLFSFDNIQVDTVDCR